MYKLRVRGSFAAAHGLPWHPKCKHLHGHTYHVEVVIEANELDEHGIVVDFGEVRECIKAHLPDHMCLSDITCPHCGEKAIQGLWINGNPTAERIVKALYRRLKGDLPGLSEVTVWESPDCGITYDEGS